MKRLRGVNREKDDPGVRKRGPAIRRGINANEGWEGAPTILSLKPTKRKVCGNHVNSLIDQ